MSITLARLDVVLGVDLSEFNRKIEGVAGKMASVGKSMASVGSTMTTRVTLPIVGLGAAILKTGADFEAAMNRVGALSGATGERLSALESQAKELGRTTQFSASQAADAMGFLAMAGFNAEQILGAMPSTLQLAAAAQMDLASAADITSNILTGYGMEVEELGRANDVLVKAFTSANTDLRQLGEAMKFAGPVAAGVGIGFEEAAAAIGLFGNAGIQGSMAGTSLRGALTRLAKPTKEVSDTLGRLGVQTHDSSGAMLPLVNIVAQLEASGASAADMMAIFGQRAGPAMMALVDQGSDALANFTRVLLESGGTAEDIANAQMKGLAGAWKELKSAVEGFALGVAASGLQDFAERIVRRLTEWFNALTELNPTILRWGAIIGGVLAAIGPLLLSVGSLLKAFPAITTGVRLMLGPWGLLITALALAAAAWVEWGDEIMVVVRAVVAAVKDRVGPLVEFMKGVFSAIRDVVVWWVDNVTRPIIGFVGTVAEWLVGRFGGVISKFLGMFAKVAGVIAPWLADAIAYVREFVEDVRLNMAEMSAATEPAGEAVEGLGDQIGAVPTLDLGGEDGIVVGADAATEKVKAVATAIQALQSGLAQATTMNALYGQSFDLTGAQAAAYETAVRSLVEAGVALDEVVGPAGETLRQLAERFTALEAEATAAEEAEKAYEARIASARQAVADTITEEERHRAVLSDLKFALDEGAISNEQYAAATAQIQAQVNGTSAALSEFQRLIDATKTDEEKLSEVQARLNGLVEAGEITQGEYEAALAQARAEIMKAESATEAFGKAVGQVAAQGVDSFVNFAFGAKNAIRSFVSDALRQLARLAAHKLFKLAFGALTGGAGGFLGGIFSGFFADGGFIKPGHFGIVGEAGPEFVFGGRSGATVVATPPAGAGGPALADASAVAAGILAAAGPPPSFAPPEVAAISDYYRRMFGAMIDDGKRRGVL